MKNFIKKSWLIITMFVVSLTVIPTTKAVSQSGFSSSSYYSRAYGTNDQFVSYFYDQWGRYCENRKRMNWTKHYGGHNVRVWNYQTGTWYYEYRNNYYYTYNWYYYWVCY